MELLIIPSSAPRLVQQRLWYVLTCLWTGEYKRSLAANQNEQSMKWQQIFSLILLILHHKSNAT